MPCVMVVVCESVIDRYPQNAENIGISMLDIAKYVRTQSTGFLAHDNAVEHILFYDITPDERAAACKHIEHRKLREALERRISSKCNTPD